VLPQAAGPVISGGERPHTVVILTLAVAARLFILWFAVEKFPPYWLYSRGIELGTLA
jgi:hypothetical protein